MNFERIIGDVAAMNLNLYDLSLYSDGRIQSHCFCPCNRCNNSYSVAKAFTMTAVGLLWEQNKLSVNDRFWDLFAQQLPENIDPAWKLVTLEHALTHRIGFGQGILDIDVEDTTRYPKQDFLRYLFSTPLQHRPSCRYSAPSFTISSTSISKMPTPSARRACTSARRIW